MGSENENTGGDYKNSVNFIKYYFWSIRLKVLFKLK